MSHSLDRFQSALQSGDMLAVSEAARALVSENPPLGGEWGQIADITLQAGDEIAAIDAAKALREALPEHAESHVWVASMLSSAGDHAGALTAIDAAIARFPDRADLHRRRGRFLTELGRIDAAREAFFAAISRNGQDALAWEGLASVYTFTDADPILLKMEELRIGWPPETPARDRGILAYALAKAYSDTGQHDLAARRVAEGAAFVREGQEFDVDHHERAMDQIIATYDDRFAADHDEAGLVDSRPVFLIAPPAAGASWLARVLAAGEGAVKLPRRNALFWLASSPLADKDGDRLLRELEAGEAEGLFGKVGRFYLDRVSERFGREPKKVVDPSTLNEMSAGVAGLALPAAKFIRLTREPRDLAWAIYARRFAQARTWTYHPDDIARVLATHEKLCARWEALFPDRFLTISYEDLAADPAATVKRAAQFAGIEAEGPVAEAWLRADVFEADPVGVHERAGKRFEPVEAALKRAGLV